jgi:valyl-tRNA synthetase
MRITPAHDKKSLMIAQKKELKIDTFAIDKNGCFTKSASDFCGKEAKEFVKNIVKNLDDIHNLESTKYIETDVAIHKRTGEKAWPLLCNQLFIKIEKELNEVKSILEQKQLTIIPEIHEETMINTIKTIEYRPITKEDSK